MAASQKTIWRQAWLWFSAGRPETLVASSIPVLIGTAWAFYHHLSIAWGLLPLVWLAASAVQLGTNMVSEYFDHCKNDITLGSSWVLVKGELSPRQFLVGGLVMFAVTAALGLLFVALRGWPILVIGAVGILGGFFYTGRPVGYKYFGLGDMMVFILMGPLMVIGSFFVLTAEYDYSVLVVSLPVGCLVTAILSGNNLRDMLPDGQAGVTTTAGLLGHRWARIEYGGLIISAYLLTMVLVAGHFFPVWSLATLLSAPLAYNLIQRAAQSQPDKPDELADIDMRTALLHLVFGVTLTISLFVAAMIK